MIRQGRVTINGQVVRELGTKVDSQHAKIAVDGQVIQLERMVYYAVSKPKGYVSTNNDPSGRPRVVDLLPEIPQRVYTVGRLDEMSTGLILLTNDGELANKLAHPKYGVEKLYRVVVAGTPTREVLDKLVEGVWLAEGKVRARRVRVVGKKGQATILEMVLAEGKNREVRRMLAKLGHKVMTLTRVAVGPITLKGLAFGEYRSLSQNEVEMLRRVASGQSVPSPRFPARKPHPAPGRGRPFGGSEPRRDSADAPPPSYSQGGGSSRSASRRGREEAYANRPQRPGDRGGYTGGRGPAGGEARRPSTGRPEYGGSESRPPRPSGPPPSQRRPAPGGRPSYGDSGAEARPRRHEGGSSYQRRPSTGGPASGSRPFRPEGPPPSQRRPGLSQGPGQAQGGRVFRPSGPPPSQRRPESAAGPGQGQGQGQGARPSRPSGPPPSQRRPPSAGGPRKPGRITPPGDEPRQRRIIGLDERQARETPQPRLKPHVIKRRPPRSALGPRKPRPKPEG